MSEVTGAFLRASAPYRRPQVGAETNRSALAEAILASREISDEFLLDPLIDGRKLLASSAPLPQRLTATLCGRFATCPSTDEKTFQVWPDFIFWRISGFPWKRERVLGGYAILRNPRCCIIPRSSSPRHVIANKIDFQGGELHSATAEVANSMGLTIEGSSFSGLLTRVEMGHIRMGLAGNGSIKSLGSGSSSASGHNRQALGSAACDPGFRPPIRWHPS